PGPGLDLQTRALGGQPGGGDRNLDVQPSVSDVLRLVPHVRVQASLVFRRFRRPGALREGRNYRKQRVPVKECHRGHSRTAPPAPAPRTFRSLEGAPEPRLEPPNSSRDLRSSSLKRSWAPKNQSKKPPAPP